MKTGINAALIFIAIILQTTILKSIALGRIKPDLILLVVIYAGLFGGKVRGITVGAAAGLIMDCMSVGVLGLNTLSKGIIGYLLGSIRDMIIPENTVTQAFFIFFSSLIDGLLGLLILGTFFQLEFSRFSHLTSSFYQALYTTLIGPFIFFYIAKVEKKV